MKSNVGGMDRAIRIILGIVLLVVAYLWLSGALMIIAYIVGAIALITGLVGWCCLYSVLGVNTCKAPTAPPPPPPPPPMP
jgi:F0F1-type ATP synthase assembly protein I